MCYAIYLTLIGLFLIYSDSVLEQFALSTSAGDGEWMVTAIGWEILAQLWPVFAAALVLSSAITFFVVRRLYSK